MNDDKNALQNLSDFLLYCLIISIVFLFILFVINLSFGGLIYKIQSIFFEISKKEYELTFYYFIALIKILAFVFFLIPYISLRLLISKNN